MKLTLVLKQYLDRSTRQARFWKAKHYSAIPHYIKPHFIDIHDSYQLRSLQEVKKQLQGREFEIELERIVYKIGDIQRNIKGRKGVLLVKMEQFQLTEMQLQRFKVLVGCRYNEQTKILKLTCQQFANFQQNTTKLHEMLYDIVMQAKRAP